MSHSYKSNTSKKDENPAPGWYNLDRSFGKDAPKYSMQPKGKNRREGSPVGPGEYDANSTFVQPKSAAWKISPAREAAARNGSATPGPGYYNNNEEFGKNAPKIKMQGKSNSNLKSFAPGPGYYEPKLNYVK